MKIKLFFTIALGVLLMIANPESTKACEIDFEIIKGEKESYSTGDTLVVKVIVALTHRSCPIAMKKTKFKMKGLKVMKSTPWKELSPNDYVRKLMMVVTAESNGKINISAIRECEKDGGFGSLKLIAAPN
ncbi:MAG: hypothetical protein GQ527_02650 [Bacteroidales bacterium]|nr:hypothetical protein [Bacteroidales bacterium]